MTIKLGAARSGPAPRQHAEDPPGFGHERIECPAQIREILDLLMREQVAGALCAEQAERLVHIVEVRDDEFRLDREVGPGDLPIDVSFTHLNTVYRMALQELRSGDVTVWETPASIERIARRRSRRVAAPVGLEASLFCAEGAAPAHIAQVVDLSRDGVSLQLAVSSHPEELAALERLTLSKQQRNCGDFHIEIRSSRLAADGLSLIVGAAIEPHTPQDALCLERLLESLLYPSTLGQARDVWEVFERSGYLQLSGKGPRDFAGLRAPFLRVAHAFESAPNVGLLAHWPASGPVRATVSLLRMYQGSWLLCQVSKQKTREEAAEGRLGLREMYLRIYERAQHNADTRWLIVYVQDEAPRWSRELHVELPRRYLGTGEGCLLAFRALEADVLPSSEGLPEPKFRVARATADVAQRAMRDLMRVRPAQYLDAFDLTEARFDLSEAGACWASAGLERERAIFVAYRGDVRCAVAVVEVAEEGAHLYGLLDCLRMYPLRPGGEWAFMSLLQAAHGWFASRGRRSFTYLEEFPRTLPLAELGFRDLGGATLSLLSVDRVPELLARTSNLASEPPRARSV